MKFASIKKSCKNIRDLFFDNSIKSDLIENNEESDFNRQFRSGIHIFHDFIFDKLSITTQAGYYFYSPYVELTRIYNRLGLRYNINKDLRVNLSLISHSAKANFVEWGIGYYWK